MQAVSIGVTHPGIHTVVKIRPVGHKFVGPFEEAALAHRAVEEEPARRGPRRQVSAQADHSRR